MRGGIPPSRFFLLMYKFKNHNGDIIECQLQEPTLARRKRLALLELSQQKDSSEIRVELQSVREKMLALKSDSESFTADVDKYTSELASITEKLFEREANIYRDVLLIILSGNIGQIDFENINEKEAKRARADFFGE